MTQKIDTAAAEDFAGKMVDIINGGFLALITSVGHRTGLFDAIEATPFNERRDRVRGGPQRALRA